MESKNLNMAMEDVEKDVIPVYRNKRESFLGLHKIICMGIQRKKM